MKIIPVLLLVSILFSCQSKNSNSEKTSAPLPHVADERTDRATAQSLGKKYAISTQGIHATAAAKKILQEGGNLMDAAIAASFVVSVERPQSTGIGGGGFMIFHEAKSGKDYAIDFRERAPLKAHEKMFLKSDGTADPDLSRHGILSVAVPGLVAGLLEIHKKFGSLPLAKVMAPSIDLAEKGFVVYPQLARGITMRAERLKKDPAAAALFFDAKGAPLKEGEIFIQKDLARTLKKISREGRAGFYKGAVAKSLLNLSKEKGGLLSQKDFDLYKVHWREPVRGTFRDEEIVSMPPPSSGGIHVLQFLNYLEEDFPSKAGFLSSAAIHLEASSLQSAFADRAKFLGDPDFVKIPTKGLISKDYVRARRAQFDPQKARRLSEVAPGNPPDFPETTHLSFMDEAGNAISTTQTVNGPLGSALVAPGTGVVLNNEMDDFSALPGASNMYGAVGGHADSIQPMKTPLSSMSPTLVLKNRVPILAIGAPGGTRIISCVAQTIYNLREFQLSLYDAIATLRIHHQWQPDLLLIDPPGPSEKVLKELRNLGYQVEVKPVGCTVMAVAREAEGLRAVADPRDIGTAASDEGVNP